MVQQPQNGNSQVSIDLERAKNYRNSGDDKIANGDYQGAIEDLSEAIRLNPIDGSYYGLRGSAYYYSGRYEEALVDDSRYVETHLNPSALYNRSEVYYKMGRDREALDDLEHALGMANNYPRYYFVIPECHKLIKIIKDKSLRREDYYQAPMGFGKEKGKEGFIDNDGKEKLLPGADNNCIVTWMRDEMAEKIGLDSEEKRKQFTKDQEAYAEEEGNRWLKSVLPIVAGKPIDKIPEGDYCYTSVIPEDKIEQWTECVRLHGEFSEEGLALYYAIVVTTRCPYQEWTDYGTVKCHFLEEEAVAISEGAYEKALKHFGSKERLEEECQGSMLLGDAVRCCNRVLESIRNTSDQQG